MSNWQNGIESWWYEVLSILAIAVFVGLILLLLNSCKGSQYQEDKLDQWHKTMKFTT